MPDPTRRVSSVEEAHRLATTALEELDRVIVGALAAKLALLVALVGRYGLVFVGPTGAGKTELATRGLGLIRDLDQVGVLNVPPLADLTRGDLVGGELTESEDRRALNPDVPAEVVEEFVKREPGTTVTQIGMLESSHQVIVADFLNRINPEALNELASLLPTDPVGALTPSAPPADRVRLVVSTMNDDFHTFALPPGVRALHAVGVDFDAVYEALQDSDNFEPDEHSDDLEPDAGEVSRRILAGNFRPSDPRPMITWAELDDIRAIASEVEIPARMHEMPEMHSAARPRRARADIGDDNGLARVEAQARILAALRGRSTVTHSDYGMATDFVVWSRQLPR